MASYVYPQVVLPGQLPPLAVVTQNDHRAWMFIAVSLGMSMTLLSTIIRVFIRFTAAAGWGLDDGVLAVSTVLSLLQSILVLIAGSHGLGSSRLTNDGSTLDRAQKLYYASNLVYILALGSARQSVVCFLRRITPVRLHQKALTALLGVESAWTLGFFVATALQCNKGQPWLLTGECAAGWVSVMAATTSSLTLTAGQFGRWQAAEITAALLEVTIFLMAIWTVIWKLQVANSKRATIAIAFAVRMTVLIAFIALHLSSFDKQGFATDPTLHEAIFICWAQAEMNVSIIGATVPIAHRFLASLVTYYGGAGGRNLSQSEQATLCAPHRSTSTIEMGSVDSGRKSDSVKDKKQPLEAYLPSPNIRYSAGVEHKDFVATTPSPLGEIQRMMIRKDVTYKIEYD